MKKIYITLLVQYTTVYAMLYHSWYENYNASAFYIKATCVCCNGGTIKATLYSIALHHIVGA